MSDEIFFDGKRYISAADASALSSFTRDYVSRLCRDGKLLAKRIGKNWYVHEDSLKRFLVAQVHAKEVRRETLSEQRVEEYRKSSLTKIVPPALSKAPAQAMTAPELGETEVHASQRTVRSPLATKATHAQMQLQQHVFRHGERALRLVPSVLANPVGVQDALLRGAAHGIVHVSTHAVSPFAEFIHKFVALAIAFTMTFGTYALVDPEYARFAIASMRSSIAALGDEYASATNGDVRGIMRAAESSISFAAENPRAALAQASGASLSFFPKKFASLARSLHSNVDALVYAVAFPDAVTNSIAVTPYSRGSVTVEIAPYAKAAALVAQAGVVPNVEERSGVGITRVVERIQTERIIATAGGITEEYLNTKLLALEQSLTNRISASTAMTNSSVSNVYNVVAQTNNIDKLGSVAIDNSTFTGGTISGSRLESITSLDVSGGATLSSLTVTGDTTLEGNLSIPGALTISSSTIALLTSTYATTSFVSAVTASTTNLTWVNATGTNTVLTNATSTNLFASFLTASSLTTYSGISAPFFSATSTAATSTFAGGLLATRSPTLAHSFASWTIGASGVNPFDAAFVVNPESAVADSNLIAAAVNGSTKFLVDAEGDVFVNNLTSVGSVTLSTTTASSFTVEGNSTFGDALTDLATVTGSLRIGGGASTTRLSVFDNAWFGGTATSTFDSAGNLAVPGTISAGSLAFTSASTSRLSIFDRAYFGGTSTTTIDSTGAITVTSTSKNTFPYASSTALTVSGASFFGGRLTMVGAGANIVLGDNYISNDGDNEGINISTDGNVGVGGSASADTKLYLESTAVSGDAALRIDTTDNTSGAAASIVNNSNLIAYFGNNGQIGFGNDSPWTKLSVTGGFAATASSTIGDGTQGGGLTISGGATTTGNAYFAGTGTFANGFVSQASSTVVGAFTNTGAATFGSTLAASGLATLSGGFVAQASSTVVGDFTSTGIGSFASGAFTGTSGTTTIAAGQGFTIGSSQFVLQQGSGRVGIGTSTPEQRTSIESAAGTYQLQLANYGTSGGAWNIGQSDSSFGAGGGSLLFVPKGLTSPSAVLTLKNSGNVGVGQTAPGSKLSVGGSASIGSTYSASAAPTNSLIVEGDVGIGTTNPGYKLGIVSSDLSAGTLGGFRLQGTSAGTTDLRMGVSNTGNYSWIQSTQTGVNHNRPLVLQGGSGSGNVGISTTSPWAKFSVHGASGDTNTRLFEVASSTASATASLFAINNLRLDSIGLKPTVFANGSLLVGKDGTHTSSSGLWPQSNAVLEINSGTALSNSSGGGWANLVMTTSQSGTSDTVAVTHFLNSALGTSDKRIAQISVSTDGATNSGAFTFSTVNAGTLTSALRISAAGNLGIGSTTPFYKLSVAGTGAFDNHVRSSYFIATSSAASTFPYASTTALTVSGSAWLNALNLSTASTSQLSVFNTAYFGGSATSTFASTGALTLPSGSSMLNFTGTSEALPVDFSGGDSNYEYYALRAGSSRTWTGREALGFHVNENKSFGIFSTNWTKLLEVEGGTGNTRIAGALAVGTSTIQSENILTLGPTSTAGEGGQIVFLPQGANTTSWAFDNYFGDLRLLRGTGAGSSNAELFRFSSTTGSVAFAGTATSTFAAGLQATALNITSTTATSSFANGINITDGCFAVDGECFASGSGASLSAANTWTALQLFSAGASTTQLSVFNRAYFGATATTTFDSTGAITVASLSANTFPYASSTALTVSGTAYFPGSGIWNSTGNVGIGTTTPDNKLSLAAGDTAAVIGITNTDVNIKVLEIGQALVGGASIPYIANRRSASDRNGALNFFTAGNSVTGTPQMTINYDGNVGIGTTTPGQLLTITGGSNPALQFDTSASTGNGIYFADRSTQKFSITKTSGNALAIAPWGGTGITMNSTGNVGIGTTTPQQKLSISSSGSTVLNLDSTGGGGAAMQFSLDGVSKGYWGFTTTGDDGLAYTSADGNNIRMIITDSGNIGIGDTTPAALFTVGSGDLFQVNSSGQVAIGTTTHSVNDQVGAVRPLLVTAADAATTMGGSQANIVISNGNTTTNNSSQLSFASRTGASNTQFVSSAITGVHGARTNGEYHSGELAFLTAPGSNVAPLERMRITSAGNVGVGTTSPLRRFAVEQAAAVAQFSVAYDTGRTTEMQTDSSGDAIINPSGDDVRINDDNLWVCAGGACPSGTPSGNGNLIVETKLGIGTSTPSRKLEASSGEEQVARFSSSNGSHYGFLEVANDQGNRVEFGIDPNEVGSFYNRETSIGANSPVWQFSDPDFDISMTILRNGKVGIGTTTPTDQLSVQGLLRVGANSNSPVTLGTATSTFNGDIRILGKLDVGTIDPVYTIGGTKYATYGHSTIGIHEETLQTIHLTDRNAAGEYVYTIAFDELEKGSDLWLFYQITEFGESWKSLVVSLTPSFAGDVYYKKDPANNQLLIIGSKAGEVSMRLSGNRYDFSKWPNLRPDQDDEYKGHVVPLKQ